ncbi:ATP-binding protein [Bacillus sp. FJAT-49736]|uniref:ATP-binding protein n=1 Tax=Bacillus sp. FJAT-49736 TaxID=2833582 RepID=UPI001BC8CA1D|nr:ATP-binding protein [Bacillus sp. FJAT-49736]MBS4172932.1 PAS domain-containing protein [Bacillus sp. FJAT-49736]
MRKSKVQILLLFLIASIIWIFLTEYIMKFLDLSLSVVLVVERIKGIFYIILTGGFIYFSLIKKEEYDLIKQEQRKLSTLINSMVDYVIFKDGNGRWIQANQFCLKLFRLEFVNYKGKTDDELIKYTPFYRKTLLQNKDRDELAWNDGKQFRSEEIIPLRTGETKTFETIRVPLKNPDGSRKALVVIGRDITKMKDTDDHLRKTEKLSVVGELAASVAHEVRNPLTSIKGFIQLLESGENKNKAYFDIILKELDRINEIVGELLVLAKPQDIIFQTCNVVPILKDVCSLLKSESNMQSVELILHVDDDIPSINCNVNQLKQVFINIIKNAIDASYKGGEVEIIVKNQKNGYVLTQIKDNGIGISAERLQRIGEPFYSHKEKGTGLGLTICFKIIESHRGKILFESELNKGTTVDILLPIQS